MLSSTYSQYANQPFSSQGRQPRAIVTINDIQVAWTEIELQTTTFYVADNYNVIIPLSGQNPQFNLNFWASEVDITVKIYIGFPNNPNSFSTNDLRLFMVGHVDIMSIDPLSATITLSGRDLTSLLIDTKIAEKYSSRTASQVATLLAQKHGLNPKVTATSGNVGNIYNNLQTIMTKESTEWDLLTFLAQQSGFVTFVDGMDLYFEPYPTENNNNPYFLQYQAPTPQSASPSFTGIDILFKRSLTLARDVKVVVRVPFSPVTGKAFTVVAQATRRTRPYLKNVSGITAPTQTFSFIRTGLTREQAQQTANQLLRNITLNEIIMEATVPGDITLRKDSVIQVRGTGTALDQIYYSDVVYRSIRYDGGFQQRIVAKNHGVDTQINL